MTTGVRPTFTPGPWVIWSDYEITDPNGVAIAYLPALQLEANARLIAAAPDLYEALRGLTSSGHSEGHQPNFDECDLPNCTAARAALAKVEGR